MLIKSRREDSEMLEDILKLELNKEYYFYFKEFFMTGFLLKISKENKTISIDRGYFCFKTKEDECWPVGDVIIDANHLIAVGMP